MRVTLHAVISIFLMALLVLINPLVAIVTSLALGACIAGIYLAFRRGALAAGRVRTRADTARFRQAHEVFGGFKELRAARARKQLLCAASPLPRWSTPTPRHADETLALVPMFFRCKPWRSAPALPHLLYLSSGPTGDLNAALSICRRFLLYGAYRLMPSLQSLMTEASVVRYTKPALDRFYWDHQEAVHAQREDINARRRSRSARSTPSR